MHTRIIVNGEGPFYIRGEGPPSLSWQKGLPLKQGSLDAWIWETHEEFAMGEFKLFLQDRIAELGENHPLYPGASIRINPQFPH